MDFGQKRTFKILNFEFWLISSILDELPLELYNRSFF